MLNTGEPTHVDIRTVSVSSIDFSIASLELATDEEWKVHDCLRGSDHFPITIADITDAEIQTNPRYIMEKTYWKLFTVLTYTRESADDRDINELVKVFSDLVISAAQQSIQQTKRTSTRRPVPWWNEQCTIANRERELSEGIKGQNWLSTKWPSTERELKPDL